MAVYEYVAFDERGKEIKGIIDADSPRLARQKLRASGIFPISLKEEQKEASEVGTKDISLRWFTKRIKLADITVMTRQLATLVGAGLPLVTSLNGLLEQTENPALKRIIAQIREKVNEGNSLAAALSEHPRVFSPLFINMVEAGEASGTLELVLERLADFIEQQQSLRYKIYATLAYP
ncbi:MAG TPA: type II secretion system protein GspF, partial [Deltaproteobacteria bacterium]|nr:type II secretion system protein GspF [Deltaproteobacteria bacterium]